MEQPRKELLIILPVRNEEKNIGKVLGTAPIISSNTPRISHITAKSAVIFFTERNQKLHVEKNLDRNIFCKWMLLKRGKGKMPSGLVYQKDDGTQNKKRTAKKNTRTA